MFFTSVQRVVCLILVTSLPGCSEVISAQQSSCKLAERYPIIVGGPVGGVGELSFPPTTDSLNNANEISFELSVRDGTSGPNNGTVAISIRGIAQCHDGIVIGQFRSGVAAIETTKILGGKFEGVFGNKLISNPFGKWVIQVDDTRKDRVIELKGHWEAKTT